MRKILIKYSAAVTAFTLLATPAAALGIGDLAKVVLGNGSVLKKKARKNADPRLASPRKIRLR